MPLYAMWSKKIKIRSTIGEGTAWSLSSSKSSEKLSTFLTLTCAGQLSVLQYLSVGENYLSFLPEVGFDFWRRSRLLNHSNHLNVIWKASSANCWCSASFLPRRLGHWRPLSHSMWMTTQTYMLCPLSSPSAPIFRYLLEIIWLGIISTLHRSWA